MFASLIFIIISCLVIWRSSHGFEIASDYLGRKMPPGIKGATLNAIASSSSRIAGLEWRITSVFAFVAVLHSLILLLNYAISRLIRLDHPSTATFTIHTSQKTLTVTYIVWSGYFASFAMGLIPVIAYHLSQLISLHY